MKVNEPITPDDRAKADNHYKMLALKQKGFAETLAGKLERGEVLNQAEAEFAAHMIRRAAAAISTDRPRLPGGSAKVPEIARMQFAILTLRRGFSKNAAIEELAEIYCVSTTAVKKRLGLAGDAMDRMVAKSETASIVAFVEKWVSPQK